MITAIAHIGLTVSDMDRSVAFYRDTLGLTCLGEMMMEGAQTQRLFQKVGCRARVAYLRGTQEKQSPPIELIQFLGQSVAHQSGDLFQTSISEVCFYTDDIGWEYARLKASGVAFLSGPQTFERIQYGFGKSRAVYSGDSDGIILELIKTLEESACKAGRGAVGRKIFQTCNRYGAPFVYRVQTNI